MLWSFQCQDARRAENVREHFLAFLHTFASNNSDFAAAELIFGELVANVVRYAPGQVVIRVEWLAESPVLSVQDHGKGFEPNFDLPDDPLAEGGRGLYLVATLGRHVDVAMREGRGATVSVTLPVWRSRYNVA
ncbi:MAG: ATP-binding protein [Candidatus Eremiobacteraeota bacterium]|nr:ATP-binding protein [Candidatus Eremiobacteraeota bacterium]